MEPCAADAAVAVDQGSLPLVTGLLSGAEVHGATLLQARRWGELGNHIAPFDAGHHVRFAEQLKRLGATAQARFEAESALQIEPAHPGAKALLVAGDTFRAAAIEQLTVWGERAGIPVLSKATGADAAGLVYEAVEKARKEDLDLVLVDTAGRLQNKSELMEELSKIIRVLRKLDPDAPHDVFLVLDATVGQNALSQVEAFRHTARVSGLVMTKLDGTAKGGVLVAIADAHALPIHFVGVGESAEDLQPFSAKSFSRALVGLES